MGYPYPYVCLCAFLGALLQEMELITLNERIAMLHHGKGAFVARQAKLSGLRFMAFLPTTGLEAGTIVSGLP